MTICRYIAAAPLLVFAAGHCSAGLLGLSNPAEFSFNDSLYLRSFAMAASTLGPLSDLAANNSVAFTPRSGGNLALVDVSAACGYTWDDNQLGLVYHQQWMARTSAATVRLYQAIQGVRSATPSNSDAIAYQVDGMESQGVQIGRRFDQLHESYGLRFGLRAAVLSGSKTRQQMASGVATTDAASALTIVGATSDINSTTDTAANGFLSRFQNQSITGTGYSIDAGMVLDVSGGMRIALILGDVANAMYWNNVPETTLSGSSVYNGQFPSGYKLLKNVTQVMPQRTELSMTLPWSRYELQLAEENIASYDLPRVGFAVTLTDGWKVGLDHDMYFGTTGLQIERMGLSFFIRFDASGAGRGGAAGLSFTHPFKGAS